MGYSGQTSFVFEVERYLNKQTGQLVLMDQAEKEANANQMVEALFDTLYEYQCIPLDVEGRSYYQEGRLFGPPENCYPDEGETEITSLIGPNKEDWTSKITQSEHDSIIEMIQDHVMDEIPEPDFDDDPYYDDGDF